MVETIFAEVSILCNTSGILHDSTLNISVEAFSVQILIIHSI